MPLFPNGLLEIAIADGREISINAYFAEHPEMMLGSMVLRAGNHGREEPTLQTDGRPLAVALEEAIQMLPVGIYKERAARHATAPEPEKESLKPPVGLKQDAYHVTSSGAVTIRSGDELVFPEKLPAKTADRIRGMVKVREAAREALDTQLGEDEQAILKARSKLNQVYERFVMYQYDSQYAGVVWRPRSSSAVFSRRLRP